MRITLDLRKSIEENAAEYFERAKRSKKKAEGARRAIQIAQERLRAQTAERKEREVQQQPKVARKLEWFQKFRWFYSSDGFLCIGGRDTATNEIVVKKHTLPEDRVLHTDMAGAPFVVVKAEGKEIPERTLEEAAQFCAAFSRAWRNGFSYIEVFCARPEQLSKEPNSGESLPRGAFVVRGQLKYFKPAVAICVGKDREGRVMAASEAAVLAHCERGFSLAQGQDKTSDVAKRLARLLDADVDEIVPMLPAGGLKLGRELRRPRSDPGADDVRHNG